MKTLSKRHIEAIEKAKTELGKVSAAALAMVETPMELIKAVLLKHEVAVIEEMGPAANGKFADFKIVEIPDDVEWEICDSGGYEWVAEKHRTWR